MIAASESMRASALAELPALISRLTSAIRANGFCAAAMGTMPATTADAMSERIILPPSLPAGVGGAAQADPARPAIDLDAAVAVADRAAHAVAAERRHGERKVGVDAAAARRDVDHRAERRRDADRHRARAGVDAH